MALIECRNITKTFGEKVALDDVSLDFSEGRVFGMLGPNGSGKTTLIRIINRITIPNNGSVYFNGKIMSQEDVYKIGYMPEERGLYRKMKVGEQLVFLARLKGMGEKEAISVLKDWFIRLNITDWWNKKVEELSKGMAQKLQFIATVVHSPKLMIFDEPFSGFDPVNADIIRKEIIRMKEEGATIILSTHDMGSVEELCDDIALINNSKLIICGELNEIRRKYGNNNIELRYTADKPIEENQELYSILSDREDFGKRSAVLELKPDVRNNQLIDNLLRQNVTINSFNELLPRMNDIFIKIVKEGV